MTYPAGGEGTAYIDIMLDLETLGVDPGGKILSIGACTFRTDGNLSMRGTYPDLDKQHQFYAIASTSYISQGDLTVDDETMAWWGKQDSAVQEEAFGGTEYLWDILHNFTIWAKSFNLPVRIWCKGAGFDEPIIRYAMELHKVEIPWKYSNVRCARTLEALFPAPPGYIQFKGDKHNALHDAIYQADCAEYAFKVLKNKGLI